MNYTGCTVWPIPANEEKRLKMLDSYYIMYTEAEPAFDRITSLVKNFFNVPIVAITLLGKQEQFVKSSTGVDVTVTSRELSFCQYTIMDTTPFIVSDTHHSDIFAQHPWVINEPHLRFYAGVPILVTNQQGETFALGALCILDSVPRPAPTAEQIQTLQHFAAIISDTFELRRERRRATEANDIKTAFLANMSHEIRTPMTGIMGTLELLDNTPLQPEQQRFVTHIKKANDYLINVMDDIFILSKTDVDDPLSKKQLVDLRGLCEQTIAGYAGFAKTQQVEVTLVYANNLPQLVTLDSMRVRQILSKLLHNAIKFTRFGTQVSMTVGYDDSEQTLQLSVTDAGIGMSQDVQAVIFDAYEQADKWLHRLHGGVGLGLSVCKVLAQAMGGRMSVNSQAQVGTTFTLHLPVTLANSEQPSTGDTDAIQAQRPRLTAHILLAEDNEVNAMVAIKTLKKYGYTLDRAKDGQQAVDLFSHQPDSYHIILMDHQMPIMDGVQATKVLKQRFDYVPPIIAVTAHAMHGDKEIYLNAGMQDYCTKPYKPEHLDKLIQHWLYQVAASRQIMDG